MTGFNYSGSGITGKREDNEGSNQYDSDLLQSEEHQGKLSSQASGSYDEDMN